MKRDAYLYAETGVASREIRLASYLDRFGVDAALGRRLYYREMKQIIVAENINMAYKSRKRAQSWHAWETDNPQLARLLIEATLLAEGGDDG